MNLIQGTVRRDGNAGDGAFGVEAIGHRLPVSAESGVGDRRTVVYGIRPEHLDIADDGFPAHVSVGRPFRFGCFLNNDKKSQGDSGSTWLKSLSKTFTNRSAPSTSSTARSQ